MTPEAASNGPSATPSGRWMRLRRVAYWGGIALGLALFLAQVGQAVSALGDTGACVARPVYLGVALLIYCVAYLVQMAAWGSIMGSLGAALPWRAVLQGYLLSFLPRYIPGSVWGYLSRNEWLARQHGVGFATATLASLLETVLLLAMALGLGGALLLTGRAQAATLVGVVALMWAIWRVTPWAWSRLRRQSTMRYSGHGWVWSVAFYTGFWVLHGAGLLVTGQALCHVPNVGLPAATALAALSWAGGFLVLFVPAGLGVREWTLAYLLGLLAGYPADQAAVLAVASRVVLVAAELIVLAAGLLPTAGSWRRSPPPTTR